MKQKGQSNVGLSFCNYYSKWLNWSTVDFIITGGMLSYLLAEAFKSKEPPKKTMRHRAANTFLIIHPPISQFFYKYNHIYLLFDSK